MLRDERIVLITAASAAWGTRITAAGESRAEIGLYGWAPTMASGAGPFYDDHREVIGQHRERTLDFATGQPTQRRHTRAKVIDEIFYIEGRGNARTL